MKTSWLELILEKLAKMLMGTEDAEEEKIIVLDKVSDFLEKLKEHETSLTIVKDPYKLAFAPYYLLWFEGNNMTTYRTFVSPDSAIWGRIQYHFKISFPSEDGSWAQKVPYEKIKKFL